MALDDVPTDDMAFFSSRDPLDAALRGESDDPGLGALVADLRSAYLPEGDRPRSDALAAFAGPVDGVALGTIGTRPVAVAARPVPLRRRAAVGAAAFAATFAGKVVLGGAVAAATLGGLHAADVVDVPLLPSDPAVQTPPAADPQLPDVADPRATLVDPLTDLPAGSEDVRRDDSTAVRPAPGTTDDAPSAPVSNPGTASDDGRTTVTPAPAADAPRADAPAPAHTPAPAPAPAPTPAPAQPGPQPAGDAPDQAPEERPAEDGTDAARTGSDGSVKATSDGDQKISAES